MPVTANRLRYIEPSESSPPLLFPLQFSANIEITSHLVDPSSEYPPRTRRLSVYYDYKEKRARADIEEGYEAAKYYIRRYDDKNEYMIRLPPIDDCKRSYLGEIMPYPDISEAEYKGVTIVNSRECNYYIVESVNSRVHMYMDYEDGSPFQLVEESIDDGVSTPLLTYHYTSVDLGAPAAEWFDLPDQFNRSTCIRHVGGFPYLHIFHYFVRF